MHSVRTVNLLNTTARDTKLSDPRCRFDKQCGGKGAPVSIKKAQLHCIINGEMEKKRENVQLSDPDRLRKKTIQHLQFRSPIPNKHRLMTLPQLNPSNCFLSNILPPSLFFLLSAAPIRLCSINVHPPPCSGILSPWVSCVLRRR